MAFYPYLFFGGNCREAFTRYQEIFGGELFVVTGADMPPEDRPPEGAEAMVMHAALTGADQLLLGSDDPFSEQFGPVDGMKVNFSTTDEGEARRVFDQLAEGGAVQMEMATASWSPAFGLCTDRFGTPWMVGVDVPQE